MSAIDAVCAEGRWMHTQRFIVTPAWEQALQGNSTHHLLLVARHGTQVVGWCRVFPTDAHEEGEVGIGLLAPYRNQGLGTTMLQRIIAWSRERGYKRLVLYTREDNERAIHVFQRCGFRMTGRREGEWVQMALPLHPESVGDGP